MNLLGNYNQDRKGKVKLKTNNLKLILKNNVLIYSLLKYPYRLLLRPFVLYQQNKIKRKCYQEFKEGKTLVKAKFGNQDVKYQAFSQKNYWHMTIGSLYEDDFAKDIFDNYVFKNDVIFDVGGHSGLYSIPFAKKVGEKGKVFVFEPEDNGYNAILKNISLNKVNNITLLKRAMSNSTENITFYTS